MTVKEIVKKYLEDNGYDGLFNLHCGCENNDLMPCNECGFSDCEPGYKVPRDPDNCPNYGYCDWHIEGEKK